MIVIFISAIGSWMLYRRLFVKRLSESHHHHNEQEHAHLDDEAHAREHTMSLPRYINSGERPSTLQIITFGAAGEMICCSASITVMLLALSTGKAAMGVFTVLGFSLGPTLAA